MARQKHVAAGLVAALITMAAQASAAATPQLPIQGIVISKDPTQNVACALGTCTAMAADAVLNASELHEMLTHADMTVSTGSLAQDIEFNANFKWINHHTLTLSAQRSIEIDRPVTVAGDGGLSLVYNSGGADGQLVFGIGGNVNFWSLTSPLTINGEAYILVDDIATLASDIAKRPRKNYALAQSFASTAGYYQTAPIQAEFGGIFEGLGNTISNLQIFDLNGTDDALFDALVKPGIIRDIGLLNVTITNSDLNGHGRPAGIASYSEGKIIRVHVTGTVGCDDRFFDCVAGGLVSLNYGNVYNSWTSVTIRGGESAELGGLLGNNHGDVMNCFSNANITGYSGAYEGGLIGYTIGYAAMKNNYATGTVTGTGAYIGGLLGYVWEYSNASLNYASVSESSGTYMGGLIGIDSQPNLFFHRSYWDTTIGPSQPSGSPSSDAGITGKSNVELKAGLPPGFDPAVWTQKPAVNGGLPYLRENPPQ
ncbi:MAG TPA: hypothetical protein VIJ62_04920 [Rhizomicrobium sp.]